MAIYHLCVKPVSRSEGRTASGSAAYRAAEKIRDPHTGEIYDYAKKKGIIYKEIVTPENAPAWALDRAQLWNAVDLKEVRKNSTVAREYELALPELPDDLSDAADPEGRAAAKERANQERARLTHDFAVYLVKTYGVVADICIHDQYKNNKNYHAHVLTSTRNLTSDGFDKKTRILDAQKTGSIEVTKIREEWTRLVNKLMKEKGISEITDKSLEAQGIDRIPQIHLGPAVVAMMRRGIQTERAEQYEAINDLNEITSIEKELTALEAEHNEVWKRVEEAAALDTQPEPEEQGSIYDGLDAFSGWGAATDLEEPPVPISATVKKISEKPQSDKERAFALTSPQAAYDFLDKQFQKIKGKSFDEANEMVNNAFPDVVAFYAEAKRIAAEVGKKRLAEALRGEEERLRLEAKKKSDAERIAAEQKAAELAEERRRKAGAEYRERERLAAERIAESIESSEPPEPERLVWKNPLTEMCELLTAGQIKERESVIQAILDNSDMMDYLCELKERREQTQREQSKIVVSNDLRVGMMQEARMRDELNKINKEINKTINDMMEWVKVTPVRNGELEVDSNTESIYQEYLEPYEWQNNQDIEDEEISR